MSHAGFRHLLWLMMTLVAIVVAVLNSRFIWIDIRSIMHRAVEHLDNRRFELYLHLWTAPLILVAGAFLFLRVFRERFPKIHRWAGRFYIGAILVTSIATLRLSFNDASGVLSRFGFGMLSMLWFATAAMAWTRAVQGRFAEHSQWMIRNYALTLTNATFRVEVHLLMWLGATFDQVYEPVRVLQWIPNLIAAELLIRSGFFAATSASASRRASQDIAEEAGAPAVAG